MNDLIERARKYSIGAGRSQEGQYRAADADGRRSNWLSWSSAVLSAVVGTSIFASLAAPRDPVSNLPGLLVVAAGLVSMIAAALGALERTAKLGERAEIHRLAGVEYGRIRRDADMLRLELESRDITREQGLKELVRIGDRLSEIAKSTRVLPDRIYDPAKAAFDEKHPEYFQSTPAPALPGEGETSLSHAGGVVVHAKDGTIEYLIVEAKGKHDDWVLPKGHIKPHESPVQTARREVFEETGVDAAVLDILDTVEFTAPKGPVKAQFFLMQGMAEGSPHEDRASQWVDFEKALRLVRYDEAQQVLRQADQLLRTTTLIGAMAPAAAP